MRLLEIQLSGISGLKQQRNGEYHALTMGEASGVGDTTGNIPDETVVHGECLQVDTVVS